MDGHWHKRVQNCLNTAQSEAGHNSQYAGGCFQSRQLALHNRLARECRSRLPGGDLSLRRKHIKAELVGDLDNSGLGVFAILRYTYRPIDPTESSCPKESFMSTANTPFPASLEQLPANGPPAPQLVEKRLEAIDQALVGLLPRHERLAAVAQVETRIRELAAASPSVADIPQAFPLPEPTGCQPASGRPGFSQPPQFFAQAPGGWAPATQKKEAVAPGSHGGGFGNPLPGARVCHSRHLLHAHVAVRTPGRDGCICPDWSSRVGDHDGRCCRGRTGNHRSAESVASQGRARRSRLGDHRAVRRAPARADRLRGSDPGRGGIGGHSSTSRRRSRSRATTIRPRPAWQS